MTEEQKQECVNRVLDTLNSAFQCDPLAIHCLTSNRTPCNTDLANHPQVVVMQEKLDGSFYSVSALGLLNGVMDALGLPRIAAKWEDGKLLGFCVYKEQSI